MHQDHPSCFNGDVRITQFKITVERIVEPLEVYQERIRDLWRHSDNWHDRDPLRAMAKKYNLELSMDDYGSLTEKQ